MTIPHVSLPVSNPSADPAPGTGPIPLSAAAAKAGPFAQALEAALLGLRPLPFGSVPPHSAPSPTDQTSPTVAETTVTGAASLLLPSDGPAALPGQDAARSDGSPPAADASGEAGSPPHPVAMAWVPVPNAGASPPAAPKTDHAGADPGQILPVMPGAARQELPLSVPDVRLPSMASDAPASQGEMFPHLPQTAAEAASRGALHAAGPQAMPERAPATPGQPVLRESLALPLRAQGWDAELGQRILWMAGRQMQRAELILNPPQLGSLEVHLTLRGSEASAHFFSPHAAVREAIDASLPRLREMLSEAGIALGQAQVSPESFGDRREASTPSAPGLRHADAGGKDLMPSRSLRGLIDLYV